MNYNNCIKVTDPILHNLLVGDLGDSMELLYLSDNDKSSNSDYTGVELVNGKTIAIPFSYQSYCDLYDRDFSEIEINHFIGGSTRMKYGIEELDNLVGRIGFDLVEKVVKPYIMRDKDSNVLFIDIVKSSRVIKEFLNRIDLIRGKVVLRNKEPKIAIIKLGHDANDPRTFEAGSSGIFKCYLNEQSTDFEKYGSEYSFFYKNMEALMSEYSTYDYIGFNTYRMVFLEGSNIPQGSYGKFLDYSAEYVKETLKENPNGIIYKTYNPLGLPEKFNRVRWSGMESIQYLKNAIANLSSRSEYDRFNEYLEGYECSYRSICVLRRNDFFDIFSDAIRMYDKLVQIRAEEGNLVPRSVGYELELYVSFRLTRLSNIRKGIIKSDAILLDK